jgi:plastocyanin
VIVPHIALAVLAVAAPGHSEVSIVDNAFRPRTLVVGRARPFPGRWWGRRRHDVWFEDGPARCRARLSGRCTRRFARVGSYDYFCTLHGSMTGRVRVLRR